MQNKITLSENFDLFTIKPFIKKHGIDNIFFIDHAEMYAKDCSARLRKGDKKMECSTSWESFVTEVAKPNIIVNNFDYIPPEFIDQIISEIVKTDKTLYIFRQTRGNIRDTGRFAKLVNALKENNIGFDLEN